MSAEAQRIARDHNTSIAAGERAALSVRRLNGIRRQKLAALDRILQSHAAWEQRSLADLRTAGFHFKTVGEARRYQIARHTVESLSSDQMVELVMQHQGGKKYE